ncbi:unnamed protein product [Ilex paraguariensis]|uniref:Uncharacterized protein n=1 Tax=Ilex paraguariensis TaxID=185542 RepID=A0ABC8S2Q5_9AQUA
MHQVAKICWLKPFKISDFAAIESHFSCKRLADGSKRVQVPHFLNPQLYDDDKKGRKVRKRRCTVLVN